MKTTATFLAILTASVLLTAGCSHMGSPDSRGAGLNEPGIVRSESTGQRAGSPEPNTPQSR